MPWCCSLGMTPTASLDHERDVAYVSTVRRWTGREAQALRDALRFSVRGFAKYLGAGVRTVAAWEARGSRIMPRPEMQAALDTALARADDQAKARFAACLAASTSVPDSTTTSRAIAANSFAPASSGTGYGAFAKAEVSSEQILHGEERPEDQTNRRTAATLMATMLAAMGQPALDAVDRIIDGRARSKIDRRLLASHMEIAEHLASLYRGADPRATLPMATAYADDLLNLCEHHGDSEAELSHLVVGVHAQVGLWSCHANLPAQARRYLATACELAASTGDRPLHARTLAALSYFYSSAPRGGSGGHPHRALILLDDALALSVKADAFTRGWLATWRADQHATLGNLAAARADVDQAQAALDLGDGDHIGGFFSRQHYGYGMHGHLNSVRALVHGIAGETSDAEQVFGAVQSQAANGRRRAASYAHQALAYAKAKTADVEAASTALLRSISLASSEHYAMGVRRSFGVRATFDPSWSRLRCVREVDEHLEQFTVAR